MSEAEATLRPAEIWKHIENHFRGIHVEITPVWVTPDKWNTDVNAFGYASPEWGDVVFCSIPVCPELIAETTAWLNEFDLEEYLLAVEIMLDFRIAHRDMDEPKFAEWFAEFIEEEAPGNLKLMTEVQQRHIDKEQS